MPTGKKTLEKPIDRHKSVAQRIADGTLSIRSQKEFDNLLKIFPDHPVLFRAYGDFLKRQKDLFKAADAYGTAAALFIEEAVPLQSIVAKVLEWEIAKPAHEEVIAFHGMLSRIRSEEKPALNFWTQLSYSELLSFMLKLTLVRFSPEKRVQKAFKEENSLFFVVSGALRETVYMPEKRDRPRILHTVDLAENDFFGTIYPFTEKVFSTSDIHTLTRVELIKITRSQLAAICKTHPDLNALVQELYQRREKTGEDAPRRTVRRNVRHHLPTQVRIKVFREDKGQAPLILDGFIDNISLGGVCVFLNQMLGRPLLSQLQSRNVKVIMKLISPSVDLTILGEIVWTKVFDLDNRKQDTLGIQFKEMSDPDRELLEAYCTGGEGEQNLMWGLWESLVKK